MDLFSFKVGFFFVNEEKGGPPDPSIDSKPDAEKLESQLDVGVVGIIGPGVVGVVRVDDEQRCELKLNEVVLTQVVCPV